MAVLMLVALGGMCSERSGVINLGLEGIMVFGALGGAMAMQFMPATTPAFVVVVVSVLVAAIVGALSSLLIAVAAINFKADQTLVGTAMNLIAPAVAAVIVRTYNISSSGGNNFSTDLKYSFGHDCFVFKIGSMQFNWFEVVALIALIAVFVLLYKTKFGLRLRSCGEHPQAAASLGISVYKMRYSGVILSGILGGIGGITFIAATESQWTFEVGVAGMGFLALAVMIFGQWKPFRIAGSAFLFALFRALKNVSDFMPGALAKMDSTIYLMLPYIVCLIVLAFTSKNSKAPKAEGIPYDKGQR